MKKKSKICDHYPMIGMMSEVKHGGCWKVLEVDMSHIVRQCVKCGEIVESSLCSYNTELFMSDKRRFQVAKDRDNNAVNMIQPIDSKTGKFNEEFGKHYGYNPLKTPAPQTHNRKNDKIDDMMSGVAEKKLKMNKLKK
jgi:hypothetical protein